MKERGLDGLNGYSEEDKATATTLSQELNAKMNLQGDLRLTMQDILRTCRNVRSVNKRAASTTGVRDKRAASTSSEATGVGGTLRESEHARLLCRHERVNSSVYSTKTFTDDIVVAPCGVSVVRLGATTGVTTTAAMRGSN